MDSLEAQDLGISEEHFEGLTHSISMPIFVSGREPFGDEEETDPSFDLAIFVIPAGGGIPLHDHPHSKWKVAIGQRWCLFCLFFALFVLVFFRFLPPGISKWI